MNKYSHIIEYLEEDSKTVIYRLYDDGKKVLYTEIPFPIDQEKKHVNKFISDFGEAILIDSPAARKKLGM